MFFLGRLSADLSIASLSNKRIDLRFGSIEMHGFILQIDSRSIKAGSILHQCWQDACAPGDLHIVRASLRESQKRI